MSQEFIKLSVKELRDHHISAFYEYEEHGEFTGSADDNIIEISFVNGIVRSFKEYLPSGAYICDSYTVKELNERNMGEFKDYSELCYKS